MKQNITDNSLLTTSKTIVGAVNELNNMLANISIRTSKIETISEAISQTDRTVDVSNYDNAVYVVISTHILAKPFISMFSVYNHTLRQITNFGPEAIAKSSTPNTIIIQGAKVDYVSCIICALGWT